MGITTEIARLCNSITFESLPEEVIDRSKYLLLDYLGVAIRGTKTESSLPIYRYLAANHNHDSGVPVPATSLRVDAPYAALALGISAHSLELDDVVNEASLHPAVSVISAALSAAYICNSSGQELIAAIVAGYETMIKLGIALDPAAHYKRGFHPTATCGTFGAGIASAKLFNLNQKQIADTLGIAGSQAAGSMEFLTDGAYTKRFHAGWSAHSGIIATALAREGFTGPNTIIEGKFGFLHSYSLSSDPDKVLKRWGEPYEVMNTSIKPHACCRYKQGAIDCILKLMKEHALSADSIKKINISILKAGFALVADPPEVKRSPASIVDAQFSMPFGAAIAILHGNAFLDQYSMVNITSDAVKKIMQKVSCLENPLIETDFPKKWPAQVEIITEDNRKFSATTDHPKGDPENPLSWDEIIVKFRDLVAPVLSRGEQDTIIAGVRDLENMTGVSELMDTMIVKNFSIN